jgi:hypothetical protein
MKRMAFLVVMPCSLGRAPCFQGQGKDHGPGCSVIVYTFQGFDNHWRMACGREGQQSLVVQAKHRKDDDNKKLNHK